MQNKKKTIYRALAQQHTAYYIDDDIDAITLTTHHADGTIIE